MSQYDDRVADATQAITALRRVGITIRDLDEAAELAAVDPVPETLRRWSVSEADAQMTAALGDPKRLAAVAANVAFRDSGAAETARRLVQHSRDQRVLALFAGAAKAMDEALCKALRDVRPRVEAAEKTLATLGMSRPRLMEHDQDGGVIRSIPNVAKGQLRREAVERRDGGEALRAVQHWEDVHGRYAALHGVVARLLRLRALPEGAACRALTAPIPAPPERAEVARRADEAARNRPRPVEHKTPMEVFA